MTMTEMQTPTGNLENSERATSRLMSSMTSKAQETIGQMREKLSSAVQSTKETASKVQAKTVSTAKATDQCIRNHPYQTIGVFFGLGVLTGILIARK